MKTVKLEPCTGDSACTSILIKDSAENNCEMDKPSTKHSMLHLELEMERNGQSYFDKEELCGEDAAEQRKVSIVNARIQEEMNLLDAPLNQSPTKCVLLFGFTSGQIKWVNVLWLSVLHLVFVWAYVHCFLISIRFYTVLWAVFTSIFSGFGMAVGAHRYWAHRGFKASPILRLFMLLLQTMTINGSAFSYARDHRNHHKWPHTHADPKNPGRGFFFAHVGWWMLKKRPEVALYGKKVPVVDLVEDEMLMFQHKFYYPLVIVVALIFPMMIPVICWNEDPITSFAVNIIRIVVVLHHLFSVNSFAHFWGYHPYNRGMLPAENRIINWISMGEGSHNYHHTFPFDYRNSEYTWWQVFNPATLFVEVCLLLRLATEPKKPSACLVQKVVEHRGKPDYFVAIKRRKLWYQIVLGILDWTFGLILAQWPMWLIALFKLSLGYPMIVF